GRGVRVPARLHGGGREPRPRAADVPGCGGQRVVHPASPHVRALHHHRGRLTPRGPHFALPGRVPRTGFLGDISDCDSIITNLLHFSPAHSRRRRRFGGLHWVGSHTCRVATADLHTSRRVGESSLRRKSSVPGRSRSKTWSGVINVTFRGTCTGSGMTPRRGRRSVSVRSIRPVR